MDKATKRALTILIEAEEEYKKNAGKSPMQKYELSSRMLLEILKTTCEKSQKEKLKETISYIVDKMKLINEKELHHHCGC